MTFLNDARIARSQNGVGCYDEYESRMRSFDHITTSVLKSDVIFEISAPVFL